MKEKKIILKVPAETDEIKPKKWYSLCPWCGNKTPCSTELVLSCPKCGGSTLAIPCGIE